MRLKFGSKLLAMTSSHEVQTIERIMLIVGQLMSYLVFASYLGYGDIWG